jgi:uncharacterized membrane protein
MVAVPYLAWAIAHSYYDDSARNSDIVANSGTDGSLALIAGTHLGTAGPLALIFVALLTILERRSHKGAGDPANFVLLIAALASYMLFGAELFYVNDMFCCGRLNTVFKLYYQAWIGASIVAGVGLFTWRRLHLRLTGKSLMASRAAAVLAIALAIGPIYYPIAAAVTKADGYRGDATLDGLSWMSLRSDLRDEHAAIMWLRENVREQAVIVEATGTSYSDSGRIAGSTGLPTVFGWRGHERQWRSDPSVWRSRAALVERLYETPDAQIARQVTKQYGIKYLIVGDRERETYPGIETSKFDDLGVRVFENESTVIYRLE